MPAKKTKRQVTREKPASQGLPAVSEAEAQAAREEVLLHKFVPSGNRPPDQVLPDPTFIQIIDQGQDALSVGVALAAVLNYLRAERGEKDPVSARMLYEYARLYDEWPGTDHEGSSLLGGIAGLMRHGVCLESEWPLYSNSGRKSDAALPPPAAALHVEANVEHLRAAAFESHAVAVAANLHEGWMEPRNGVIGFGAKRDKEQAFIGGHAFAVIGYTSQGFLVQNSWGREWGGAKVDRRTLPGVGIWTFEDAAANLTDAWIIQLSRSAYRAPLVGYDADSLDGDDLLEIKAEVNAFSYVLASHAIRPPLALGLFGDWGSGKSFFMREMHTKIQSLASLPSNNADRPSPFCRQIVQIRFNAWHYLDADLWASLVTEIFDRLFVCIGGTTGKPEEKLPKLTAELQSANGVYQQAKRQLDDAEKARTKAETALKIAVQAREDKEETLLDQLDDVRKLIASDPEVGEQIGLLARSLGAPELEESFDALAARAKEMQGLGGRFLGLMQTMFSAPWSWARLLTLILAILAPVIVVVVLEALRRGLMIEIGSFQSFAVEVSTLLAALTTWLGVQAKRGAGLLATLEETHQRLDKIREERRAEALAEEEGTLLALQEKEDAARKSAKEAEERVQALQREIDDLQPGRLITRFIEERSRSSDYRSRLGIVSLVRRDFERLSELADPESEKHDAALMPVERIVLYIDDLDRCKPDRVIEVLEAVHLLLAFRLFMVIVAVDPRWLRHCLEKHYPDLLVLRTQQAGTLAHIVPSRPATAQDYLEKIFQIPFMLQPLKDDGYRRLIRGLTELNRAPEATAPVAGRSSVATIAAPPATLVGQPAGDIGDGRAAIKARAKRAERERAAVADSTESQESAIEHLQIRSWELEDMERLAPLFHTPRAVKRFVNTYRFLRAGVRPQYISRFEGSREDPGTYRGALALLAIVVSYSNVAPRFLRRILDRSCNDAATRDWLAFLRAARDEVGVENPSANNSSPTTAKSTSTRGRTARSKRASPAPENATVVRNWEQVEWMQLCDALLRVSKDGFPVCRIDDLQEWVYTVSRFSFSMAPPSTTQQNRGSVTSPEGSRESGTPASRAR